MRLSLSEIEAHKGKFVALLERIGTVEANQLAAQLMKGEKRLVYKEIYNTLYGGASATSFKFFTDDTTQTSGVCNVSKGKLADGEYMYAMNLKMLQCVGASGTTAATVVAEGLQFKQILSTIGNGEFDFRINGGKTLFEREPLSRFINYHIQGITTTTSGAASESLVGEGEMGSFPIVPVVIEPLKEIRFEATAAKVIGANNALRAYIGGLVPVNA